ncbi:lipoprotein [Streptomyces hygroscopicus]|nr:lipoprotein [Streptomyces hygroscopicus]
MPQGRTRRAAVVSAMCALVVTGAGLTGCSSGDPDAGTNGLAKLPADKIQSRTREAAKAASAVHLSGTVVSNGGTYTLDMRLKGEGGTGSVTSKNGTFRLLRVGEHLFLKADAAFWNQQDGKASGGGSAAAASKLDGMYVKVPTGDPAYKRFSGFTDKDLLLDGLLTLHGTLATDGRNEQNGVRTVRITGDKGAGGMLDVSLEGVPYPLRLVRAGNAGTLSLSDWGKDFTLAEPSKQETVDYGKQLPTS